MYQTGLAASQIAEQLHTSESAILRRLKEAGATRSNAEAQKQAHVQGRAKAVRYWAGKKQPDAMVKARSEKISGPNHYAWKGGKAKRDYRKNVQKEVCEMCDTRQNLGIHHKDLDHYNNDPENLQVLCVSCHMSLHKKAYWDAIHKGETPQGSNGPVGWSRE